MLDLLYASIEGKQQYVIQPRADKYNCSISNIYKDISDKLKLNDVREGEIISFKYKDKSVQRGVTIEIIRNIVFEIPYLLSLVLGKDFEDGKTIGKYDISTTGLTDDMFKSVQKTEYEVTLSIPKVGEHLYNALEASYYEVSENRPYLLTGTCGESWVVNYDKLRKAYVLLDGTEIPEYTELDAPIRIKTKGADEGIRACKLPLQYENLPIETGWGDYLFVNRRGINHADGDYIMLCGTLNSDGTVDGDMWSVNGEVFKNTYRFI